MQLRLPWSISRTAAARPAVIDVAGRTLEVAIVRHRRARRYVLRVGSDGRLRLTVPRGASIAGGLRFASTQRDWILRERMRHEQQTAPWQAGTVIWLRGRQVPLEVHGDIVSAGGEAIVRLKTTSAVPLRDVVEAALRARATEELASRARALAAEHGLMISGVAVRNQRSRWGTCSPKRKISLNWRLIQMPAEVSDYVIFHELMHLRQPNHSRRFWREVAAVCPWWREAERWLRANGRALM